MLFRVTAIVFANFAWMLHIRAHETNPSLPNQVCDTNALMAEIPLVERACCKLSIDCESGYPSRCNARCAPVFLDFATKYGRLCREVLGGLDLDELVDQCSAIVADDDETSCSVSSLLITYMENCAYVDPVDPLFCEGPCALHLFPALQNCGDPPEELRPMFGIAMDLIARCHEPVAPPAPKNTVFGACNALTVGPLCATHPINDPILDPAEMCYHPCIQAIVPCLDIPALSSGLSPATLVSLRYLRDNCNHGMIHGIPGDGICSTTLLGSEMCADSNSLEGADIATICADGCTQELMDCVDSTALAQQRAAIEPIVAMCMNTLSQGAAAGSGDGICQILSLDSICPEIATADPDYAKLCVSGCIGEIVDCEY
eukprot:SAG11_NODE_7340_length_1158_cov_2.072710_1_plen_373_part_00